MSGTSADSIDAALVDFSQQPQLLHYCETPIAEPLRRQILDLYKTGDNEIMRMGQLDQQLGQTFAQATIQLLKEAGIEKEDITAIGSHGQTIRHQPPGTCKHPFTTQIGNANQITQHTGINTVADFRRRDMAAGGQGAPLVPAFHKAVFSHPEKKRVIVNIGGIANISILDGTQTRGFDTGPGNCLMDVWIGKHQNQSHDHNGQWAASGRINEALVEQLLQTGFFLQSPPKSTGREAFHLEWLEQELRTFKQAISPADVQASLLELTARSIIEAIGAHASETQEIFICGGGAFNPQLMARLQQLATGLPQHPIVDSTASLGIAPESVEATAFAWLARQTILQLPGNCPETTGAGSEVILGGIYFA